MRIFFFASIFLFSLSLFSIEPSAVQFVEMRELCKKAQAIEKKNSKLLSEIDSICQKEKTSAPIIRNIYEILARCFTVLFNIQRFSDLLILNYEDNKNDFVRCSIVIKNFASYFKSISSRLGKRGAEISVLKRDRIQNLKELDANTAEYNKLCKQMDNKAIELGKTRKENIIQNDVVCHIAAKSESIEELDAELEAENVVGVLKNTKVSTNLSIAYPVAGKISSEFGDKGADGEMIYYISFETLPGAIVTAPADGVVVFSGKFLNYGNMLIISNGDYRVFLYGMETVFASTGDVVQIGDFVGKMGEKNISNPLVRMELKKSGEPLDPRHWLLETMENKEG